MKQWTVLIYSNGNNELEAEEYQRFIELQNVSIEDRIKLIVQIARADSFLVNVLRPDNNKDMIQEWQGVRRYEIINKEFKLIQDLGKINMASPNSLTDFIIWGIKKNPSSRIMLIVSGHGAGFVGLMTDSTQDRPYMMDLFGLTNCLYSIKARTGKSIDCLVFNTCFANMVEVWNEITMIPNKAVKYIIAPANNLGLEGLSYDLIISSITRKISLRKSLIETIKTYNGLCLKASKLLLVDLNKKNFNVLKDEINNISQVLSQRNNNLRLLLNKWCLFRPSEPLISILDLNEIINDKYFEGHIAKNNLRNILEEIVVSPNLTELHYRINEGPALYLPLHLKQYLELRNYYDSLSFSQDNSWLKIVGGLGNTIGKKDMETNYLDLQAPVEIPIKYVVATIIDQNPTMTQ